MSTTPSRPSQSGQNRTRQEATSRVRGVREGSRPLLNSRGSANGSTLRCTAGSLLVFTTLTCTLAATTNARAGGRPDVISGSIPSVVHWTSGGAIDGLRAYSFARTACNVGTANLDWFTNPDPRHPVFTQNLYRLESGRFEQLGQSWVMEVFCALQQSVCGTCSPACGGCCNALGPGCAEPSSASTAGQFQFLGPRSEINAHNGTNLGNHALPQGDPGLRGRLLVRNSDLDPALNAGALYFAELHAVAADDAQFGDRTGDNNNASYRRVTVIAPSFNLAFAGGTVRESPAIHGWQSLDPDVTMRNVDIPGEGRLILAYLVTDNGDGTWHYDYALHNLNSDRSVGAFSVPIPGDATLQNIGFHDVDSHSGEPYSVDDWPVIEDDGSVTWSTEPFAENENANALRWGTLYNFRFDAPSPPQPADITIGLFKPGTPNAVTVPAVGPSESCPAPAFAPGVAGVSFIDRAFDGFIDARAESTDGSNVDLGLDTITVEFNTALTNLDGSPLDAAAFTVTDTGGSPPTITAATTDDGRVVALVLSDHIALQQWTTITINARAQCGDHEVLTDSIIVGYLPADVDQNGLVGPLDLLMLRRLVNGKAAPLAGTVEDYIDANRDGSVSPFDLLAFRQLVNGTTPATRAWAGETLPSTP